MLRSMLFSLLLVTASQSAIAQTACPAGVAPGSPQCGPDSGTSRAEPAPPRILKLPVPAPTKKAL